MFHVCLCFAVLSVPCSLVITCRELADPLAILCVVFSCVSVTFPYDVPVEVWYLIVSIPDLCLLPYFEEINVKFMGRQKLYSHWPWDLVLFTSPNANVSITFFRLVDSYIHVFEVIVLIIFLP